MEAFICEDCNEWLIEDSQAMCNVCYKCWRTYPYTIYIDRQQFRKSPPYKRRWHFMEVVRSFEFCIPGSKFELIFEKFIKIDRKYSDLYPGKNLVNYKFLVKYIAEFLGFNDVSEKIPITWSISKILRWKNKLDEVMQNLRPIKWQ
jgi:hypothetical protein